MKEFGQVITAMITPFNEDGSVDYEGAAALAKHLAANGSDGILVCGTTGEGATMTDEEKLTLFKKIVEAIDGSASVIANTGSNDTQHSIELTKEAEKLGVDGILAIVPYYNKPNQEGCFQHFKAIAESTSLPVILYNVPGRTGGNLLPSTVKRVVDACPNVVGIKEASGNLEQAAEIHRLLPENFLLYSGDDSLTLPMLAVGGVGIISVASHVIGSEIKEMITAFFAGDVKKAAALHAANLRMMKDMFITVNPIPVKTCVRMMGLPGGYFRLPMVEASDSEKAHLEALLKEYHKI